MLSHSPSGDRVTLHSPTAMPQACGFLWNRRMLLHVNCRGFVTAQHMQPEPGKYAHAPFLEARTFMQPEQPLYAQHPGRFVFLRDEATGQAWSLPHEPMRRPVDSFRFEVGQAAIGWVLGVGELEVSLTVSLPVDAVAELWTASLRNTGAATRRVSLYPCFSVGYMSWMNQSAAWDEDLQGLVARSVSPYQRLEDYPRIAQLKDWTALLADQRPDSWEARLEAFEGEGGWANPAALARPRLGRGEAHYETPIAALQYALELGPGEARQWRFVFAPGRDAGELQQLRARLLAPGAFEREAQASRAYLEGGRGCLRQRSPDAELDAFANHWLPRQVWYHGDTNRLTTNPQTRNYLQDALGMVYVEPARAKQVFRAALSQQQEDGGMPDGVLLSPEAEQQYINQVPHMDHCVWLPVCLAPYLDETGDWAFLREVVIGRDGQGATVFERVCAAMRWLLRHRDARGLSLIAQGDWCDPMNMVGPAGRGVSGWLTIAAAHALRLWVEVARELGEADVADELGRGADELAAAAQAQLWDGDWFARGISDAGRRFGVATDEEGRIFLNPQSWALLAGIADADQRERIVRAVDAQLDSPWGVMLLAPAFTRMHEHIGRVTQKFPGSAENGSIYNHAAAFWIHALYRAGEGERAWTQLRRMLPGPDADDLIRRGQLPVFIPNYYRGAVHQFPRTAGRSSQMFNTGTASWIYRVLVEDLFGLRGSSLGLHIDPALPRSWGEARVERRFRGASFSVTYRRGSSPLAVTLDGALLDEPLIRDVEAGRRYTLDVKLPA